MFSVIPRRGCLIVAASALVFIGLWSASSAEADPTDQGTGRAAILANFRETLVQNQSSDVPRFDSLSESDRATLAEYLSGESDLSPVGPPEDANVARDSDSVTTKSGIATWTSTFSEESDDLNSRAATYKVHSYADETFTLAGITISRTRVWADYVTGSGVVKSLTDYGCQLVSNNDPFSSISVSKQSGLLSSGRASYKCYVVVKRGVPTPWGQISTTTRSAYQYMSVTGAGVSGHGWT